MELINLNQCEAQIFSEIEFDYFIVASGFEERSTYLASKYIPKAKRRVAIAFLEKSQESARKHNDDFLKSAGFDILRSSGSSDEILIEWLREHVTGETNKKPLVLVDISCMTKVWYAAIVNYFLDTDKRLLSAGIYFSYSFAKYEKPEKIKEIKYSGSIFPGKSRLKPGKPTAMILGLGIEKRRAEHVVEAVSPEQLYIMYADPAPDSSYVQAVFDTNSKIISKTEIRNIFNYPLLNIEQTNCILTSLCLELRLKYNVVIVPLGPKIHSLLSIFLAARYPDIDVWRVSSGEKEPVYLRKPTGEPVVLHALVSREFD